MKDAQCIGFLQWALPQLDMKWSGFRKVRKQVCKRVATRLRELELATVDEYRLYLDTHADEWQRLDALCVITISRFCRDRAVFTALARQVLPALAQGVAEREETVLYAWCAGCASGEEPYTLALLWAFELQPRFPDVGIDIVATDTDANLLRRARAARYQSGSLRELPEAWRERAFARENGAYLLKPQYQRNVRFLKQDIRRGQPDGPFDLVLCRNLVFTYYDDALRRLLLQKIVKRMNDGGALVLGIHEHLPENARRLPAWLPGQCVYRKRSETTGFQGTW